jgi:N-acetylmuramoyl-L-alanine amidase
MKTIIIDPGHGGEDPGALGKRIENGQEKIYKEADFTWDISKRLWSLLAKEYSVFLTRKENETKSLQDRTLLARKLSANLFLSIHINSATTNQARGYEAYCVRTPLLEYTKFLPYSKKFRDIIILELEKDFPNWVNRGGKEANFYVIKFISCPSVLVELGFISNPNDLEFLTKDEVRQKIAITLKRSVDIFFAFLRQR